MSEKIEELKQKLALLGNFELSIIWLGLLTKY